MKLKGILKNRITPCPIAVPTLFVCGLEGCGKTTLIRSLEKSRKLAPATPTSRAYKTTTKLCGSDVKLVDSSNLEEGYWSAQMALCHGVVFVVDIVDPKRLRDSDRLLKEVAKMGPEGFKKPFLVLFNNKLKYSPTLNKVDISTMFFEKTRVSPNTHAWANAGKVQELEKAFKPFLELLHHRFSLIDSYVQQSREEQYRMAGIVGDAVEELPRRRRKWQKPLDRATCCATAATQTRLVARKPPAVTVTCASAQTDGAPKVGVCVGTQTSGQQPTEWRSKECQTSVETACAESQAGAATVEMPLPTPEPAATRQPQPEPDRPNGPQVYSNLAAGDTGDEPPILNLKKDAEQVGIKVEEREPVDEDAAILEAAAHLVDKAAFEALEEVGQILGDLLFEELQDHQTTVFHPCTFEVRELTSDTSVSSEETISPQLSSAHVTDVIATRIDDALGRPHAETLGGVGRAGHRPDGETCT